MESVGIVEWNYEDESEGLVISIIICLDEAEEDESPDPPRGCSC